MPRKRDAFDEELSRPEEERRRLHARARGVWGEDAPPPPKPGTGRGLAVMSAFPGMIGRVASTIAGTRQNRFRDYREDVEAGEGAAKSDRQSRLEIARALAQVDPDQAQAIFGRAVGQDYPGIFEDLDLTTPTERRGQEAEDELRGLYAKGGAEKTGASLAEGLGILRGGGEDFRLPPMSPAEALAASKESLDPTGTYQAGYGQFVPGMETTAFPEYESPEDEAAREREEKLDLYREETPLHAARERATALATSRIPQRTSAGGKGISLTNVPAPVSVVFQGRVAARAAAQGGELPEPEQRAILNDIWSEYLGYIAAPKDPTTGQRQGGTPAQQVLWRMFDEAKARGGGLTLNLGGEDWGVTGPK